MESNYLLVALLVLGIGIYVLFQRMRSRPLNPIANSLKDLSEARKSGISKNQLIALAVGLLFLQLSWVAYYSYHYAKVRGFSNVDQYFVGGGIALFWELIFLIGLNLSWRVLELLLKFLP